MNSGLTFNCWLNSCSSVNNQRSIMARIRIIFSENWVSLVVVMKKRIIQCNMNQITYPKLLRIILWAQEKCKHGLRFTPLSSGVCLKGGLFMKHLSINRFVFWFWVVFVFWVFYIFFCFIFLSIVSLVSNQVDPSGKYRVVPYYVRP